MITFGKNNLFIHRPLDIIYHATQVPLRNIGTDYNLPAYILAVDRIRSGSRTNLGHIAQGNFSTVGIDHQIADIVHRRSTLVGSLDRQVKGLSVIIYLADYFATKHDIHIFLELRQRNTELCQDVTLRCNRQLRTFDLLFYFQVHQSFNSLYRILNLISDLEHPVQVRSEQLDGDIRFRTRKHCVNTMRYRLTYLNICSRDSR